MTTITLTNSFHNTEATFRPTPTNGINHWVSRSVVRRMRRELCGMSDCKCGGSFGERGPMPFTLVADAPEGFVIRLDQ